MPQPSAETESEGSVFDTQKLSDGTEDLDQSDFSSNRLVVLTDDKALLMNQKISLQNMMTCISSSTRQISRL